MLGFLAAIITVIFSLTKSESFQKYKRKGYFDLFLSVYLFTVINLVVTFFLSFLGFTNNCHPLAFNIMLMSVVNNGFQILLVTIIIVNLIRKSGDGA